MNWTFDFDAGLAYADGKKNSYVIDIWDGWFESRIDGDSIDKFETLEDAIKSCELEEKEL